MNQDPAISEAEASAFLTCARIVWERGGSLQDKSELIGDIIWEASGLLEIVQDGIGWLVRISSGFEGDGTLKPIEIPQGIGEDIARSVRHMETGNENLKVSRKGNCP